MELYDRPLYFNIKLVILCYFGGMRINVRNVVQIFFLKSSNFTENINILVCFRTRWMPYM